MKSILTSLLLFLAITVTYGQKKDTVTTKSGIKYFQLKQGKGDKLKDGQTVKVFYTGKFKNGKKFETNTDSKPFKFKLGAQEVIPGWDEGFKLMSAGEKGILIIPSELAYGKRGVKLDEADTKYHIPPNTDLIFEVEIVSAK